MPELNRTRTLVSLRASLEHPESVWDDHGAILPDLMVLLGDRSAARRHLQDTIERVVAVAPPGEVRESAFRRIESQWQQLELGPLPASPSS